MASAKQLALLKAGVEGWNEWREEDDWQTEIDLSEADLRKADLRDADVRVANLRGANLRGAHLRP